MSDQTGYHTAVESYLRIIAGHDQRIFELLNLSVGRVSLKTQEFRSRTPMDTAYRLNACCHIRDWFEVALADGASWLSNLDDQGRPKKLMKLGSLAAILAEADRQMARKQSQMAKTVNLVAGDEEFVFDCGDGWSIVRLLTPAALDRESTTMQHCVGHGAYDARLAEKSRMFLSLRDPKGHSHVTCELHNNYLIQMRGKQNALPLERYIKRLLPYLTDHKINCCEFDTITTDSEGVVHSVYDLPETLHVDGDITLYNPTQMPLRLPRKICATGSVVIHGAPFIDSPEEVIAGGFIDIRGPALKTLPKSFSAGGSLFFSDMDIGKLPDHMHVSGDLCLRKCRIGQLPGGLYVKGKLDLSDTDLTELPSDLKCGRIVICRTKITTFDTGVFHEDGDPKFSRTLDSDNSDLATITGDPTFNVLRLTASKVELPHNLTVTKELFLNSSRVVIGAGMNIVGSLFVSNCDCDIDAPNLGVSVSIRRSKVSLPESLSARDIFLNECKVKRQSKSITCKTLSLSLVDVDVLSTEVHASVSAKIDSSVPLRIKGKIVTPELWIRRNTTHLSEEIETDVVGVSGPSGMWRAPLSTVLVLLAAGVDLDRPPEGVDLKKVSNIASLLANAPQSYESLDQRIARGMAFWNPNSLTPPDDEARLASMNQEGRMMLEAMRRMLG